jgi:hypothetical protein
MAAADDEHVPLIMPLFGFMSAWTPGKLEEL